MKKIRLLQLEVSFSWPPLPWGASIIPPTSDSPENSSHLLKPRGEGSRPGCSWGNTGQPGVKVRSHGALLTLSLWALCQIDANKEEDLLTFAQKMCLWSVRFGLFEFKLLPTNYNKRKFNVIDPVADIYNLKFISLQLFHCCYTLFFSKPLLRIVGNNNQ